MPESQGQGKEYYEKHPGYVIKAGSIDPAGIPIDISIITDLGQGFTYSQNGNKFESCNQTSYESVGWTAQDKQPAKVIRAEKGDIVFEAITGDIILRANNIRIIAKDGSGEVTISSNKNITISAPIVNTDSTNVNISGKNNVSVGAGAFESFGKVSQSEVKGTEIVLEPINSLLSGAYKWLKLFLPRL
jgi:hypothetical protein